jgi:hypothetical protein
MDGSLMGVGTCEKSPSVRNRTMTERLVDEKMRLEKRLSEINGLLDKLSQHPEVQDVIDELFKVGF